MMTVIKDLMKEMTCKYNTKGERILAFGFLFLLTICVIAVVMLVAVLIYMIVTGDTDIVTVNNNIGLVRIVQFLLF